MQLSEAWLREWANPPWDSATLGSRLTMAGLEVEGRAKAAPPFTHVVVGKVLECKPHPKAEKLSVCMVTSDGKDRLQIICGASNARAGLVTAVARVGAELPGLVINAVKLRDVESNGMLCSASELGLGDESEGILELPADAPIGRDLREVLGLDDTVFEINLTPNRGDCLSVLGVSREVAAIAGLGLIKPRVEPVAAASDDVFPVKLSAPEACPKFVSRIIRGVDARAPSPLWLTERLRRSGLRSINPIVDVTNYVMLEFGTPMHAFDLAKLRTGIDVRRAKAGEKIVLLDGQTVELAPDELVIADAEGAVGFAGVMGGQRTAVSEETRDVLFEIAFFQPAVVGMASRRHALITDAAQRFERGVDPRAQERSVERATRMLIEIAGGKPGRTQVTQVEAKLPAPKAIRLRRTQVARLIGVPVSDAQVRKALEALEMKVEDAKEGWTVTPPSHRFDLSIEEDLVEEVARLVGFDTIAEVDARIDQTFDPLPESVVPRERALIALVDRGYHEAITYSFVDPALQTLLFPGTPQLALSNPIAAEMGSMRVSLWPGLVTVARENLRRQQNRIRLVESGRKFLVDAGGKLSEVPTLAGIVVGGASPEQWGEKTRAGDFYDVKGDVEAVLALTGAAHEFEFHSEALACLHPGRSARIYRAGAPLGWIGELHPESVRALDLTYAPLVFELETEAALRAKVPEFEELSKFPSIRRDLAVVVDESVPLAAILEHVSVSSNKLLRDVRVFDVYRGPGVDSGRKSVALGLILQETSRTLTDQDADQIRAAVVERLRRELNASIRDQ